MFSTLQQFPSPTDVLGGCLRRAGSCFAGLRFLSGARRVSASADRRTHALEAFAGATGSLPLPASGPQRRGREGSGSAHGRGWEVSRAIDQCLLLHVLRRCSSLLFFSQNVCMLFKSRLRIFTNLYSMSMIQKRKANTLGNGTRYLSDEMM